MKPVLFLQIKRPLCTAQRKSHPSPAEDEISFVASLLNLISVMSCVCQACESDDCPNVSPANERMERKQRINFIARVDAHNRTWGCLEDIERLKGSANAPVVETQQQALVTSGTSSERSLLCHLCNRLCRKSLISCGFVQLV